MKDSASYVKECELQVQSPREALKSFKQGCDNDFGFKEILWPYNKRKE